MEQVQGPPGIYRTPTKSLMPGNLVSSTRLEFPWKAGDHPGDEFGTSVREEWATLKRFWEKTTDKGAKAMSEYKAFDWACFFLPCLGWLTKYDLKQWALWDLLAGVSVALMVVPQGMSYATLAGLPVVWGLYGAFTPLLIYPLFGSSKQLGIGPVAVTSTLLGNGLTNLIPDAADIFDHNAPDDPVQIQYNQYATQVAFLVAVMYTAVGIFRLGFLMRLLSHSVITGFTSGAAILIGLQQVQYILGVKAVRKDTIIEIIKAVNDVIWAFNSKAFAIGFSCLAFLFTTKIITMKWPRMFWLKTLGPAIVSVVGIATVKIAGYNTKNPPTIPIVKTIPKGLPPCTISQWAPILDGGIVPLAIIIMLVDMLESTSIARALARKNNYQLNYNQEIIGLGLANFMGAAFSAYTTTGSFSRSAVNNDSGAKTQLACFITGITVMFVLLFLTPVFQLMPYCVMGAIIIAGVAALFEYETAYYLFKTNLRDFVVWLTAFICTLFLGVELGLAISIGLAMLIVIFETAFPHTALLGRLDKSNVYRNVEQYPSAELTPGVMVVRLDAPIYFANVQWFQDKLQDYEQQSLLHARAQGLDKLEYVILDLTPVNHLDSMGVHLLSDLAEEYHQKGISLYLCNPNVRVLRMLERSGITKAIGRENIFVRVHDAVTHCKTNLLLENGQLNGE